MREDFVRTVRIDVPEAPGASVMLVGLKDTPGPEGEMLAVKATEPEKPCRLVTVIVDELEAPASTVMGEGLAVMAKPADWVTVTLTVTE